jgi:D-alanyl-D-alanine dipeptidase
VIDCDPSRKRFGIMSKKKKAAKQPSSSDKVVAYLKTDWQSGQWGLDDLALHLFPDFDSAPGTVRDACRRSAMHAFNGARAKLMDLDRELVIPKAYYKQKAVAWAFATASEEDGQIIQKLLQRKEAMKNGFGHSYEKAVTLVQERGWLVHQKSVAH